MTVSLRLSQSLLSEIMDDLRRRHPFAAERVGFLACKPSRTHGGLLLAGAKYLPLADTMYVEDSAFGGEFNSSGMRAALQLALDLNASMLHVHLHDHKGVPRFSPDDREETQRFVPDFWNVKPNHPHGAFILSKDAAAGLCWLPGQRRPVLIDRTIAVGLPTKFLGGF